MEERADRAWTMTEGLGNAPAAQLRWRSCAPPDTAWCPHATADVQILLLKTSLAEPKSKLFLLQDLSALPQGRLENCAPSMELNGEVTRNSFSWFQAVSINPGMNIEAYNLNNHSPSVQHIKGAVSTGFQIMGSGNQPSANPRLQLVSAQAQK